MPDTNNNLKLGQYTREVRAICTSKTCLVCKKEITPQQCFVHFETFKTEPYESLGIKHKSVIAWRVNGWSHLTCQLLPEKPVVK